MHQEPHSKDIATIEILTASNKGFIVRVGCETFIVPDTVEDVKNMMEDIGNYLLNPHKIRKEWYKKKEKAQQKMAEEGVVPAPMGDPIARGNTVAGEVGRG